MGRSNLGGLGREVVDEGGEGPVDADTGVGEVDDVGGRRERQGGRGVDTLNHSGASELAKATMDRVLGEEPELLGDVSRARPSNERAAMIFGSDEKLVQNGERLGSVLAKEAERSRVPVLY